MAVYFTSPISVCLQCPCLQDREHDEDFLEFRNTGGNVISLIAALDYKYTQSDQLTSSSDARMMYRLLDRAGYEDLVVALDNHAEGSNDATFPIKKSLQEMIRRQSSKCVAGDWFIFFFAGHGTNVPDTTGEEQTGQDQAFVLPDKRLRLSEKGCLLDDEFALTLDRFVPDGVRILCVIDCCHSGTICDIDTFKYNHEIYQISATEDHEEAEDHGFGGTFTLALREALQELSLRYNDEEFSIHDVFEATERRLVNKTDEQHISFQWKGADPRQVAWPLCYKWREYVDKLAPQYWSDERVKVAGEAPFWVGEKQRSERRLETPAMINEEC